VDSGCPGEPAVLKPGVVFQGPKPLEGFESAYQDSIVDQPSPYRLFVFIVPREELAAHVTGWENFRTFLQGATCQVSPNETNCARVTTGLYLLPEEISNVPFVRAWLEKALGLEPLLPQTPMPPPGTLPRPSGLP
jgi:hypothetical protein